MRISLLRRTNPGPDGRPGSAYERNRMRTLIAALGSVALTILGGNVAMANTLNDDPNNSRTSECQTDHSLNFATCGIHLIELGNIF